jgi:hypothetical protein
LLVVALVLLGVLLGAPLGELAGHVEYYSGPGADERWLGHESVQDGVGDGDLDDALSAVARAAAGRAAGRYTVKDQSALVVADREAPLGTYHVRDHLPGQRGMHRPPPGNMPGALVMTEQHGQLDPHLVGCPPSARRFPPRKVI